MKTHYTEVEAETIRASVRGRRIRRKHELAARCLPLVRTELSAFRAEVLRGLDAD